VTTRPYRQALRADSADQTRRRILDALYDLLGRPSATPVSVDRVAQRAGVARSTVYLVFGSRAGLYDALGTDVLRPGGLDRLTEAVAHPDAREHLRGGLAASCAWYDQHRDVMRALFSTAALDPEAVGGYVHRWEHERAGGMDYLARRLADQGELRPGLTAQDAAHELWILASFDTFDLLRTGRGLPLDEAVRVLVRMAEASLCQ
jgi:AcrR family transcriptional regulator